MSVIKLSDFSAVSVRAMLRFMYTGKVDETVCMTHTMDVLHLAAQHYLQDLKTACAQMITKALCVQTVPLCLVAAHLHELNDLKTTALISSRPIWLQ